MNGIADRLQLPPHPTSVAAARRFVAAGVGARGATAEIAILLASELASNAVMHARTTFEVALHLDDEVVRVEAYDTSPTMPPVRTYAADSIAGRGLHMIAATSERWGFDSLPEGKVVWFELRRSDEPDDA